MSFSRRLEWIIEIMLASVRPVTSATWRTSDDKYPGEVLLMYGYIIVSSPI